MQNYGTVKYFMGHTWPQITYDIISWEKSTGPRFWVSDHLHVKLRVRRRRGVWVPEPRGAKDCGRPTTHTALPGCALTSCLQSWAGVRAYRHKNSAVWVIKVRARGVLGINSAITSARSSGSTKKIERSFSLWCVGGGGGRRKAGWRATSADYWPDTRWHLICNHISNAGKHSSKFTSQSGARARLFIISLFVPGPKRRRCRLATSKRILLHPL